MGRRSRHSGQSVLPPVNVYGFPKEVFSIELSQRQWRE
jgi:hypothetical protein